MKDHQDHQGQKATLGDQRATKATQALRETLDHRVNKALKVREAQRGQPVIQALQESRETLVLMGNAATKAIQALKESPGLREAMV